MSNSIKQLPAHIANQIAAGEVIQRPASAVKELLENAVDAGATEIKLVIEDAGKSLVQVIDNGSGMGLEDAMQCFGRHATSKITDIDDLFRIKTMGFRGEALASVAAVSQVVLKTRRESDELGVQLEVENSVVTRQTPCSCAKGTSISMKNLFFNVPARRNFLKTNVVELKHITDEFLRVALSFPEIAFAMNSNGQEVFRLDQGNLKQRIIQVMGNTYASRLVHVEEKTDYLDISGFIGKPDTAKKTRGDQYLFVNNRYIRNAYLNHAIISAYEELIPDGSFPFFTLFLGLDPAHVDVNVHPTKQEIKFDDEKIVYAFIKSAIRHALAQQQIAPAMDFGLDPGIQQLDAVAKPFTGLQQEETRSGGLFKGFVDSHQAHRIATGSNLSNWRDFFESSPKETSASQSELPMENFSMPSSENAQTVVLHAPPQVPIFQLHLSYIVFEQPRGMTIVHQQLAHQQVLFEKFRNAWSDKPMAIQQSLFPQVLQLSPQDAGLLQEIIPDLLHLGYLIEPFGNNSFVLQGSPADHPSENDQQVVEMVLEEVKESTGGLSLRREKIARSLARKHAVKSGTVLSPDEMRNIVLRLSLCERPMSHFDGRPPFVEIKKDYLSDMFKI